jgi:DNA polymerase I
VLQRDPLYREKWIRYSAYDAKSTWQLRQKLEELLRAIPWREDKNLFDYYWMHMRPFGEVLTDMERRGIRVAADDYLAKVEMVAREDRNRHDKAFREWAKKMIGIDGLAMNPASSAQLSTFLFGGAENPKTKERSEQFRVFSVPREDIPEDALEAMRLRDQAPKANEDGANADKGT